VSGGTFARFETSFLARALADQFFADKNPSLWRALPWWVEIGLGDYIACARASKIRGFTFPPRIDQIVRARKLASEKRLIPVRTLMTQSPEESTVGRIEGYQDFATLSSYLVRYLLEGPGRKGPTKDLLPKVMTEAVSVLDGVDKDAWKKSMESKVATKAPMTEAEEEEEWRNRKERASDWSKASTEQRKKFYAGIHESVFGTWTPEDWERLDRSFARYVATAGR
jgi:hypothetical protein